MIETLTQVLHSDSNSQKVSSDKSSLAMEQFAKWAPIAQLTDSQYP